MEYQNYLKEPTGFFRTYKLINDRGGFYRYIYSIENELVTETIEAKTLIELKDMVDLKGFLWGIVNHKLALKSCNDNHISMMQLVGSYGSKLEVPSPFNLVLPPLMSLEKLNIVFPCNSFAINSGKYIYNYREKYEKHYGVKLPPHIKIHHINQCRDDNSIQNLVAVSNKEHGMLHSLLNQIKTRGFVQPITDKTPVVFEYPKAYVHKLIYSFIVADSPILSQIRDEREMFYYSHDFDSQQLIHSCKLMYIPAEDWETLEHSLNVNHLHYDDSTPVKTLNDDEFYTVIYNDG